MVNSGLGTYLSCTQDRHSADLALETHTLVRRTLPDCNSLVTAVQIARLKYEDIPSELSQSWG